MQAAALEPPTPQRRRAGPRSRSPDRAPECSGFGEPARELLQCVTSALWAPFQRGPPQQLRVQRHDDRAGRHQHGADGRMLSGQAHPDLAPAAADAVRQWQFTPTLLNNEAVEVVMTVTVRFDLEG
jgi:hypothetical protein